MTIQHTSWPNAVAERAARRRPLLTTGDPRDVSEHADRWLAHVVAGRIDGGPGTTPTQRARHARNERILSGERA